MNRIPVQALLALQSSDRRQMAARPTLRVARPQAAVLRRLGIIVTVLTGFSAAIAMTQTATQSPAARQDRATTVAKAPIAPVKLAGRLAAAANVN
ncbi:hypothetical protein [uncultured Rhodoblastus sp.]|uniref:hypothetical protein n=1 Tax=uncultured Rhodoblastus sp. TaxID=543037 RepID=UPI0025E4DB42|nr:hypothetical protein [uncultured Rhodoblastus sp.]